MAVLSVRLINAVENFESISTEFVIPVLISACATFSARACRSALKSPGGRSSMALDDCVARQIGMPVKGIRDGLAVCDALFVDFVESFF